MIGREVLAEDHAREQLEKPPGANVEIISLEDGRVMIRETFGLISRSRANK